MKTYIYESKDKNLEELFATEYDEISEYDSILIQVFSGEEKEKFQELLSSLKKMFPRATVIASSTDGEIHNDKVLLKSTIVSISLFDATEVKIAYSDESESFLMGERLAKKLVTPRTKLLIAFADGILCNGEEFLNGVFSVAADVKVAGGLSGDNAKFENCYIGCDDSFYERGAVAVALDSDILQVESFYDFGWTKIGVAHTITHSDKNRVYTIDGMPAVDFYKKYLGENIAASLPVTGVEFPLIIQKNSIDIARAVLHKYDDGSLSFAGNVMEGIQVYLGVGDKNKIMQYHLGHKTLAVESFYIYSCMARRRFLNKLIEEELKPFAHLAPVSGFFTYGEFYTDAKPELLNQTLTAVSLSESTQTKMIVEETVQEDDKSRSATLSALMHILSVTTEELHQESKYLESLQEQVAAQKNSFELIQELAHLGSWELDLKSGKITWSEESFKIYQRDPALGSPTYLEFINMIMEEDRKKLTDIQKTLNDGKVHSIEIRIRRGDGKYLTVVETAKVVFRDEKPYKMVGISMDITELKFKDTLISQQSKLAQMGEMVNMIAHQWRQPLNAISAAAIKLDMQDEMGIITSKSIKETTKFIEDMTQDMSQTINDFMNFTKPTDKKQVIKFQDIIDDIMRLMSAQLKNHNIEFIMDIEENLTFSTYKKDLEHVLINLFSNARDAFEERNLEAKKIKVKAYMKDEKCIIKVSDNAGGIKHDVIDRIFEPYFTTKAQGKGTGLGLFMSKKIVTETLDGSINVKNIENGAEFSILLLDENVLDENAK